MTEKNKIRGGTVWPTMITPFDGDNKIDLDALDHIVNWYMEKKVGGIFAVCQSSEMFFLTLEERVKIAGRVNQFVNGKIPVVASGHISDTLEEQINELKAISDTGVDAVVLVSNRLAREDENDDIWIKNAEIILKKLPDVKFGIYECPYPYKRLMTPKILKWCISTGRFYFLKDTCCDLGQIKNKLKILKGTEFKLFNANSATLLESLKSGASGYSGVMANFHPQLYKWLVDNWEKQPDKAQRLQDFLGAASLAELKLYPVNAKYHMKLCGIDIGLYSRVQDYKNFTRTDKMQIEQLFNLEKIYINDYIL